MFKNKYRIVTDNYAGFEAQVKYWWSFSWKQLGMNECNTHKTIESAEECCRRHAHKFVKYVEI